MPPLEPTPAPLAGPVDAPPWRDRLALLLESTGDGIFGVDLDGRCIFANGAAARLLGHAVEALLGCNMHRLIHHSHGDGSAYAERSCPIFQAFRSGRPCRIDSDVLWRRDGSSFPAQYSSAPIVEDGVVRGAVVTFVDISERKRSERLLHDANEALETRVAERTRDLTAALDELRRLSAHAHSVREDERTRIAREIHDEFGSLLVGLRLDTAWLRSRLADRPELAGKCHGMSRTIEAAVENVGRIITDLRPSLLDHQGLAAALEWQVAEFARTTEIECRARITIDRVVAAALDDALATALFRIVQELLSNIARHAAAGSADVVVERRGDALVIEVGDDGRGASPTVFEQSTRYGIRGIRERAGHFGGDLRLAGRDGGGICATVTVPLPALALALAPSGSTRRGGTASDLAEAVADLVLDPVVAA